MSPRTRSLILALVLLGLIAALRERSIRRHEPDLHDWPQEPSGLTGG